MRLRLLAAAGMALPLLAACQAGQTPATAIPSVAPSAAPNNVSLTGFRFVPAALTVSSGTTVIWTNADQANHTVTADDQSFDSGPLGPSRSFSRICDKAGTVRYHCNFHPSETGTITVQ